MPTEVKGAVELRKALRNFTPDLAKGLTKEMSQALKPIVKVARGYMPNDNQILSNWGITGKQITAASSAFNTSSFPKYVPSIVKANIGFKTSPSKKNSRGFRSLAQVFNKTRAGAIYEIAGRKNPESVFVQNLDNKFPSKIKGTGNRQGRGLYRAYEEDNGKALLAVLKAIENAKTKLNKRSTVRG
jgi:hypothetical protein